MADTHVARQRWRRLNELRNTHDRFSSCPNEAEQATAHIGDLFLRFCKAFSRAALAKRPHRFTLLPFADFACRISSFDRITRRKRIQIRAVPVSAWIRRQERPRPWGPTIAPAHKRAVSPVPRTAAPGTSRPYALAGLTC